MFYFFVFFEVSFLTAGLAAFFSGVFDAGFFSAVAFDAGLAAFFSGDQGMKAVVKIVIPLGVQAISPLARWICDPHIIEIAFGHDAKRSANGLRL